MFKIVNIIGQVLKPKVISNAKVNSSMWAGRQKTNLSPSTNFMCMTKSYFDFKFSGSNFQQPTDDEFTYENERAKIVGNNFHEYLQSVLSTIGVVKLCETTMEDPEHHIKARLDLVLEINKKLYLVELKSAKDYSVKLMLDEAAPDIEHIKQVQLYFHLYDKNKNKPEIFEALQGRPLDDAIILYETKDKHQITEFLVKRNNNMIKDLLYFADMTIDFVNKGQQPNFKFEPDSRECMYKCKPAYYELCHGKAKNASKPKSNIIDNKTNTMWGISDARENVDGETFI